MDDPVTKFIDQEVSDQAKALIMEGCNRLPVKQREALLLYFYEGLSYKEIAETMGMTRTKSARALIYRAIDSLSSQLTRYKDLLYPHQRFSERRIFRSLGNASRSGKQ